jgi:O-antigen/teichoic acid export membrane protein
MVAPYQAAYAEALARGDREWIRKTATRVLKRNVALMGTGGLGMIVFGPYAIHFWTRGRVTSPRAFLAAMAVYFVCMVWTSANSFLLIGIGRVKTNGALHGCVAAVYLLGSLLLLPRFGVIALPITGAAGYLIDGALSLPLALRHLGSPDARAAARTGAPEAPPGAKAVGVP